MAAAHYQDYKLLTETSKRIGGAMRVIHVGTVNDETKIFGRG